VSKPLKREEKKELTHMTATAQLRAITTSRSVLDAVKQIMLRHEDFDPVHFIQGAATAFDLVINAYVKGNKTMLKKLLGKDLFEEYVSDIDAREKQGNVLDITVHGIHEAKICDVDARENKTRIAVSFKAEETIIVRDNNGQIIEGDADKPEEIEDIWVFEQELHTDDPTWYLVQTQSQEDATG
jgi:predicted lipid-binding transport protein (Tim44 family)